MESENKIIFFSTSTDSYVPGMLRETRSCLSRQMDALGSEEKDQQAVVKVCNGQPPDVMMVCSNGCTVPCHGLVLAASCDLLRYFQHISILILRF